MQIQPLPSQTFPPPPHRQLHLSFYPLFLVYNTYVYAAIYYISEKKNFSPRKSFYSSHLITLFFFRLHSIFPFSSFTFPLFPHYFRFLSFGDSAFTCFFFSVSCLSPIFSHIKHSIKPCNLYPALFLSLCTIYQHVSCVDYTSLYFSVSKLLLHNFFSEI